MKKKDTTSGDPAAWDTAAGGRITPQEVQQKEFRVARFGAGYRMREVDEFLDRVTDAMSALVAENEQLRQGSASGSPATSQPPTALPADDAGGGAVDAFLRRERGFLQDLGGLVQAHAEELRSMVRDVRRDVVAGPVAPASTVKKSPREPAPSTPESEPTPEPTPEAATVPVPEAAIDTDAPPEIAPEADAPGASEEGPIEPTEAVAEEPIRLDEPEPARSGRSDEEEEGSLRELFWGEE